RLPRPAAVAGGSYALEQRMRNPRDPLARYPELRELVDSAPRMDHNAVDGLEHAQPRLPPAEEHAGEIVRREDKRPLGTHCPQPAEIRVGPDEPLHVDDVR